MNDLPGNYDAWRQGPFGRFERAEERKEEAYSDALSDRDSELREDPIVLAEAIADAMDSATLDERWLAILQAAAQHKPSREIGEALTRLVNDVIDTDARRYAEEASR